MDFKWIILISTLSLMEIEGVLVDGKGKRENGMNLSRGLSRIFSWFGTENVEEIVTFRFTSRENADDPQIVTPGSSNQLLKKRVHLPLKVVSHGFREKGTDENWATIAEKFVNSMDVNVITVDWGRLSNFPFYFSVARRVHLVGNYLGQLLLWLIKEGVEPDNIHLIGFSLGSHVVAFAAKSIKPITIARITGLDPALPGFEDALISERLDMSDAQFVDVVHTNGGVYGFVNPLGHADFYVNGGKAQPCCRVLDLGTCSHNKAVEYFAESINPLSRFASKLCTAIPETGHRAYMNNCTETDFNMGLYLDTSARGIFLTETSCGPASSSKEN